LPAGCFNPYSGVKTSVLMLDKGLVKKSSHVLFIKITNDGYDLGAQRREHDKNDLPLALEAFNEYKESISSGKSFDEEKYRSICTLVEKEKVLANKDIVLNAERYFERGVVQTDFDLVKLSEVCEVVRGVTFGKHDQVDYESEDTIKVATTKACQENGIVDKDLYNIPKRFIKDDKKLLCEGDILISTANSLNLLGRTTYVGKLNYKSSFGAFMTLVRANRELILPTYLLHCLKTVQAKQYFDLNANTTTNISNLTFESLNAFEIPLPPLEKQEQIVKEIEGYQKDIENGRQIISQLEQKIKDEINKVWGIA
jgi:type I restriction enzyme M protein